MGIFEIENLTFTYPGRPKPSLENVSFSVAEGDFVVLCGASGSGKTTLLRLLKPELSPAGSKQGRILYTGKALPENDEPVEGQEPEQIDIGVVLQNPQHQIVTDKVWHELAFGPENLGWSKDVIGVRIAEMAGYFGIQHWFRKEVKDLSGGQKQLLNLAAVMVMNPKVLLLDEPTSQLDPVAAEDFLDAVAKINREMGTTIIITEHRLDYLLSMCDRMLLLDTGKLVVDDLPKPGIYRLAEKQHPMVLSMPAVSRAYLKVEQSLSAKQSLPADSRQSVPLDVREGRRWLATLLTDKISTDDLLSLGPEEQSTCSSQKLEASSVAVKVKNVWFRYSRHEADVLRGLSMEMYAGETIAVVGGNGSGKSTLLRTICGLGKPYSGKVKTYGKKVLLMPQDPQSVFASETVEEELQEMVQGDAGSRNASGRNGNDKEAVLVMAKLLHLEEVLASHPYDISGGEQQRVVLGKILLANPDIVLMDEPTKGMDNSLKRELGNILMQLKQQGKTIVIVSHDIEFCATHADRCAMLFDGKIVSQGTARELFSRNRFYTTACSKMSNGYFEKVITPEDVAYLLKKAEEAKNTGKNVSFEKEENRS